MNLDITKKSIKQIAVISAFATLLMVSLISMPAMKSYALSLSGVIPSLGSNDKNDRSIDTDNFLSCLGVATDCNNVNKHDNPTTTTPTTNPPSNPDNAKCAACFIASTNPTQLAIIKGAVGLNIDASNDALCNRVAELTGTELHQIIAASIGGAPGTTAADAIIACLIKAGFSNLA